jgi:hypothetical protein
MMTPRHRCILLWNIIIFLQKKQIGNALLTNSHLASPSKHGMSAFFKRDMSIQSTWQATNNQDPQKATSSLYNINIHAIRYLGKGPDAIVRKGCVLLPPTDEYQHFLMRTALWVYAMGWDDENQEQLIRCVALDNPTPFTMAEMIIEDHENHNNANDQNSLLLQNLVYRGGNTGGDVAMMFHSVAELGRMEIGNSGMYEGGLEAAIRYVKDMSQKGNQESLQPDDRSVSILRPVERFKFFFNYCQFSPNELESMLASNGDNPEDGWISLEVPPEVILAEWDKNECWKYLRNRMKQQKYL